MGDRPLALIVDDMATVRRMCRRILQVLGYEAREYEDGEGLLRHLAQDDAPVAVLVLDVRMPSGGDTVFRQVRALRPEQPVLLVSGHSNPPELDGLLDDRARFLAKPFSVGELEDALKALNRGGRGVAS